MKKALLKAFILVFALVSMPLTGFADDNVEAESDLLGGDSTLASGYYYLQARNDATINNVRQEAYAYALYREGKWLLGANHKLYENDPSTIFKITNLGDGKYTFENLGLQKNHYLQSTVSGTIFSNTIEFVDDATIQHEIRFRTDGSAYIIGGNNTLHYRVGGQTLVKNNGTDNVNARWYFLPVTEAKVQQILAKRALLDAEAAYDSAFAYTYDITKGLITDRSQFSALGPVANVNYGVLLDNNLTTYLSLDQVSSTDANPRYLQVDMGDKAVQSFVFKYARCLESHTYRIRDLILYASEDGTTWNEIRTFRNLPIDQNSNGWYSGGVTMDKAYRYLRFEVLALALDNIGSTSNEQLRMQLSEFQIYAATRNETASPSANSTELQQALASLSSEIEKARTDVENASTTALVSAANAVRSGIAFKYAIIPDAGFTTFYSGKNVVISSEIDKVLYINGFNSESNGLNTKEITSIIPASTGVVLSARGGTNGTSTLEGDKMLHSFLVTTVKKEAPTDNLLIGSDEELALSGTNYAIVGNSLGPFALKTDTTTLEAGKAILAGTALSGTEDSYPLIIDALTTLRQAIATATTFDGFTLGNEIGEYTLPEPLKTNYEKALANACSLSGAQNATDEQYIAAADSVLKYRTQIDEQIDDLIENVFKEGFYRIESKAKPGYYLHCDHLSAGVGNKTIYGQGAVTDLKNVPGYYANLVTYKDNSSVFYIRQSGENWIIQSARNQTWNGGGQDQGYLKGALYDESQKGTIKFTNLSETEQVIEDLGGGDFAISFAHNQRHFTFDKNNVITDMGGDDLTDDNILWHFNYVAPNNQLFYNLAIIDARGALAYYPTGTNPGCVPDSLAQDLRAQMTIANAGDTASISKLKALTRDYIAKASENIIPVTPGYYYFINAYQQFKARTGVERGMYGAYSERWLEHVNLDRFNDPKTTPFVFRVTEKDPAAETFNIFSCSRNLYIQKTPDTQTIYLGEDTSTGQMFINRYGGFFQIVGEDLIHSPFFGTNPSYGAGGTNIYMVARQSFYVTDGYSGDWFIRKANADVTVSNNGYTTLYAPFPTVIPEGVKVYAVSAVEGDQATLTQINGNVLAAKTPVIVVGKPGNYTFESTLTEGAGATTNLLSGTDATETRKDSTVYALSFVDGNAVLEIAAGNAAKLSGWSAYLVKDENLTTAGTIKLVSATLPEGIATLTVNDNKLTGNTYYDLQGRRVTNPTKGIYIRNGKKVYIDK